MIWLIYLATINGKQYVGLTSQSLKNRQRDHLKDAKSGGGYLFHHELRKNELIAEWSILVDNIETVEHAMQLERHYIATLRTKAPLGLNLTDGGDGTPGWFVDDQTREKISNTLKRYFEKPENRAANSATVKDAMINMSAEDKETMRQNHLLAIQDPEYRRRVQEGNKRYYSDPSKREAKAIQYGSKPFLVYTLDGEFVGEWINKAECVRVLKLGESANLRKVLDGKSKYIKGYKAHYKE